MYHTGKNPLRKVRRDGGDVQTVKSPKQRRLHKAFLRWHDPENWPLLREALQRMGRQDLVGAGTHCLIPWQQPLGWQSKRAQTGARSSAPPQRGRPRSPKRGGILTQHTGLPPRRAK
jgi:hypothetical protein